MKKSLCLLLSIVSLLDILMVSAKADGENEPLTLTAANDTHIQYGSTNSFGNDAEMLVKSGSEVNNRTALIKFDMSSGIIEAEQYNKIYLRLYVSRKQTNPPYKDITLGAYKWNNNWSGTAKWSDVFGTSKHFNPSSADLIGSCTVSEDMVGKFVQIDVTAYVKSNWNKEFSFALKDITNIDMVYYFSSIDTTLGNEYKPQLVFSKTELRQHIYFSIDDDKLLNGSITGTVKAVKPETDIEIFAAIYNKNDTLKKLFYNKQDINSGDNDIEFILPDNTLASNDYFKMFLWKELVPLSDEYRGRLPIDLIDKFEDYINELEKSENFKPTGITKSRYLDVMEKCLEAYTDEEFKQMIATSDLQTYSRIVCTMAVLLSEGRITEYRSLWEDMMTQACNAIESVKGQQALDFSVKELMIAYTLMKDKVSDGAIDLWRSCLGKIVPTSYYLYNTNNIHNINVYNLAGEWLREFNGMTNTNTYFASCWPKQLKRFDKNGMYLDNHPSKRNPVLYDLTTRVQMQLISGYGYNGEFSDDFDRVLKSGGYMTLFTQSSAFELPYGGRSNQYLFNEGLISSNCEFEAVRHKRLGDYKTAGAYKRAARLAISSIDRWLDAKKHIKNFYSDEFIGTESYGYFNKYMITLGSFVAIGYLFADDSIEEFPAPAETGGFVFETSDNFNKIFANCAGYSIEIDTNPEFEYDSAGLGRIHRRGIPTELGLSIPFTKTPSYNVVSTAAKENLSIEAGWDRGDGTIQYLSSVSNSEHRVEIIKENAEETVFSVVYYSDEFEGIDGLRETYSISENGVNIRVKLINPAVERTYFRVPLLVRNGDNNNSSTTEITVSKSSAKVTMNGYVYDVSANGSLILPNKTYANRNGEYKAAVVEKEGVSVEVLLKLYTQIDD